MDDADVRYRAPNDARWLPNKPILFGEPAPTTAAQPQRGASGPMEDVEGATATSSNPDRHPTCKLWAKGSCKFPAESCKAGKHSNCSNTDAPSGSMINKAKKTNNNLNELLTGLNKAATWSKDLSNTTQSTSPKLAPDEMTVTRETSGKGEVRGGRRGKEEEGGDKEVVEKIVEGVAEELMGGEVVEAIAEALVEAIAEAGI
jgi:hypothetical protein